MKKYQQGDVLITPAAIPAEAAPIASRPIMEGEGHHEHVIAPTDPHAFDLYEHDGILYMRVHFEADLVHRSKGGGPGEHGTLTIAPGEYRIGQVHEWDPWSEEARPVID